ncbi:multidrug resistance protein MdtC [Rhodoferax lithotrophicus]|uniref:Multidrug resistance protein MdtC n=1 Tax=Rhodoferax lithotrophicus TaxID=2798804 RepID=A0ABM7MHW6_9BURK|nr:efflux RND transporter permease subunit [Rhodoferax sp. MIZ03]BCO25815.1 multidrug resistance protein MdtC [Rhodoferax sp. MIZ03]
MNLSSWSIRNPVPAILLFIILTAAGLFSLHKLGIQNFPDLDVPTILVSASLEGAAPAQLETEVARKIEDKLASVTGVDHITSTITDGAASISVSFDIDKDSEVALNEVRNAVDGARADLPTEMAAPVVSKVTQGSSALLTYTVVAAHLSESDLSWFVDNDISKALLSAKGVGAIKRVGGVEREMHVTLDPALMAGLGVTANSVSSQIKAVQTDASGGRGTLGGGNQSVRTLGRLDQPEQLAGLAIPLTTASTATATRTSVRLDQIATVSDTAEERFAYAALNGKPVVGFQVTRQIGSSEVSVAATVRAAVKTFSASHPQVQITEVIETVTPTQDNYDGSMHLLYEGAILAVVVVWLFLRDWRATFVSAVALPLSIIPTFIVMYLLGYSLNLITLLSLSLVVGVLVDDAIVEVENIVRHLRMGKTPMQAALEAANEIGLAVVATTFTLVAVFLPTAFMSGIPGKFFRQFGITSSVAVLASLLVARLLTPMMAAYLLKPSPVHVTQNGPLMRRYLAMVHWCQTHRRSTMLLAGLFFIGSVSLVPLLSTSFISASDTAQTTISLKLQPGSTLAETRATAAQAQTLIAQMPEVTQVFTVIGDASSDASSSTVNEASLTVSLTPRGTRARSQSEVEAAIRHKLGGLPGTRVGVMGMGNGQSLDVTLASDDALALNQAAAALIKDLRTLKGIGNITDSSSLQRPEIHVRPDPVRMAEQGVTTSDLASVVRVATYGDYATSLAKFNLPQRQIPIRVRFDDSTRSDLDALGQLRVAGRSGAVPLTAVADLSLGAGPSQVARLDRMRNVTLSIELGSLSTGEVDKMVQALPSIKNLPSGVQQIATGDAQRMAELFTSFGGAMLIGILCIYAVLVLLFHDFMQPATILAALPLSVGGALLALLITGSGFSMSSVIGLLMLMGIVTKNSILLVEYAVVAYHNGMGRYEALVDACHKRAQPILMTTIAMVAGMLPIALGWGTDSSFRGPMAVVVIGGLITSTVLSLLVIPVVFTYVDDLLLWLRKHLRHRQPQ